MKRFVYFVLLVAGIGAASYLVLFSNFAGVGADGITMFDYLKTVFELIKAGNWVWSDFTALAVFTYGLVVFLFINAVLLVSLLVMALTTFFRFSKVYRFYATAGWFLFAAILFTGVIAYVLLDKGGDFMSAFLDMPWQFFVPLGSALVLAIIGSVFKNTEKN